MSHETEEAARSERTATQSPGHTRNLLRNRTRMLPSLLLAMSDEDAH